MRRTRARMDFEWCFGTFVPCFGGQTTKGGQEPAKHGIDHTPDPVAMQWPCLPEHKLRTLRTRSVRRASGLVQTALSYTGPLRRTVLRSRIRGPNGGGVVGPHLRAPSSWQHHYRYQVITPSGKPTATHLSRATFRIGDDLTGADWTLPTRPFRASFWKTTPQPQSSDGA